MSTTNRQPRPVVSPKSGLKTKARSRRVFSGDSRSIDDVGKIITVWIGFTFVVGATVVILDQSASFCFLTLNYRNVCGQFGLYDLIPVFSC